MQDILDALRGLPRLLVFHRHTGAYFTNAWPPMIFSYVMLLFCIPLVLLAMPNGELALEVAGQQKKITFPNYRWYFIAAYLDVLISTLVLLGVATKNARAMVFPSLMTAINLLQVFEYLMAAALLIFFGQAVLYAIVVIWLLTFLMIFYKVFVLRKIIDLGFIRAFFIICIIDGIGQLIFIL